MSIDFSKARRVTPEEREKMLAKFPRYKNGKLKIKFAPQVLVKKHMRTLNKILFAMSPAKGNFLGALITDESSVHDFALEEKELDAFGARLGLGEVDEHMTLVNIASAIDNTPIKYPRRFKDYVVKCNMDRAVKSVVAMHGKLSKAKEKSLTESYRNVILRMLAMVPRPVGRDLEGWSIEVGRDGDVHGRHPKEGRCAVEFVRWERLLSMPVITPFGVEKTVAHIMWEATFISFDQKKIQAQLKAMEAVVKEIKAGKAKLRPVKDAFKSIRKRIKRCGP